MKASVGPPFQGSVTTSENLTGRFNLFAGLRWSHLPFIGLVALVVYLVALPLGLLIVGGFTRGMPGDFSSFTFAHYIRSYGNASALLELFYNSFVFATGSVLLALPIAITFAWLIERTNAPLRNLAYALVIAP